MSIYIVVAGLLIWAIAIGFTALKSDKFDWEALGKIGQFTQSIVAVILLVVGAVNAETILAGIKASVEKIGDDVSETRKKVDGLIPAPPPQSKHPETKEYKKTYWTSNLRAIPETPVEDEIFYLPNKDQLIRNLVESTTFRKDTSDPKKVTENLNSILRALVDVKKSIKINESALGPDERAKVDIVSDRKSGGYKIIATKVPRGLDLE